MKQALEELLARIRALQDEVEDHYREVREEWERRGQELAGERQRRQRRHKVGLWRFVGRARARGCGGRQGVSGIGARCLQSKGPVHHWLSHGTPSLLPSICVPGQLRRKYFASAQERICEQCVRPSQPKVSAPSLCSAAGLARTVPLAGGSASAPAKFCPKCW